MKLLGIDYGTKKIGLALSDDDGNLAFPKEVIQSNADGISRIASLVRSEKIEKVVLGESKDFKGEENIVMAAIQKFKDELQKQTAVEIVFEPEFMSTAEARHGQEGAKQFDASAAAIILQSYIDKQKHYDSD